MAKALNAQPYSTGGMTYILQIQIRRIQCRGQSWDYLSHARSQCRHRQKLSGYRQCIHRQPTARCRPCPVQALSLAVAVPDRATATAPARCTSCPARQARLLALHREMPDGYPQPCQQPLRLCPPCQRLYRAALSGAVSGRPPALGDLEFLDLRSPAANAYFDFLAGTEHDHDLAVGGDLYAHPAA